jgi:hypothetical protein
VRCANATADNGHLETTWMTPGLDGKLRWQLEAFEHPTYDKYCYTCAYWTRRLSQRNAGTCIFAGGDGPFADTRANLSSFNPDRPWVPGGERGFKGFSGRLWDIEFLDGRAIAVVQTNNLWYAGEIPPLFIWRVKVNARLVGGS